jgi:hypothetical protein
MGVEGRRGGQTEQKPPLGSEEKHPRRGGRPLLPGNSSWLGSILCSEKQFSPLRSPEANFSAQKSSLEESLPCLEVLVQVEIVQLAVHARHDARLLVVPNALLEKVGLALRVVRGGGRVV